MRTWNRVIRQHVPGGSAVPFLKMGRGPCAVVCLVATLLGLPLNGQALLAETWAVKPSASQERRLAPELDLVRRSDCRFKGICRRGKAVFSGSADKANVIRTMAVKVAANAPEVDARSRRLLIKIGRAHV